MKSLLNIPILLFLTMCVFFFSHASALENSNDINRVIKYNGVPIKHHLIEIYAHRGGRGLMPENSLPAYHSALRIGVDYIDMDINMTKDGVLVVAHDSTLNPQITRNAHNQFITKRIPISKLTLQQLQQYNIGELNPHKPYAHYFPYQRSLAHVVMPSLKQVIDYVKSVAGDRVGFQIEIKNDPTQPQLTVSPIKYADALYKLLKQEGVINRTEVQAYDFRALQRLQQLDSSIKTAYLTDHTTDPMSAHSKIINLAGVWTAGVNPAKYNYSYPRMVKAMGGSCWDPYEMDLNKSQLQLAHRLGLKVVAWCWPEEEGMDFNYKKIEQLISWGVDGIITDRPDILRGLLAARGYNLPRGLPAKHAS